MRKSHVPAIPIIKRTCLMPIELRNEERKMSYFAYKLKIFISKNMENCLEERIN